MWSRVIEAFLKWKSFETAELGPQTAYLSPSEAQKLSVKDFEVWCEDFRNRFLAERIHRCDELLLTLEDLKGAIKQENVAVIVDGMIRLCVEVKRMIGEEIDAVSDCLMEVREHAESLDPIRKAGEIEEEIRKLMANFKTGFEHMEEYGFPPPE